MDRNGSFLILPFLDIALPRSELTPQLVRTYLFYKNNVIVSLLDYYAPSKPLLKTLVIYTAIVVNQITDMTQLVHSSLRVSKGVTKPTYMAILEYWFKLGLFVYFECILIEWDAIFKPFLNNDLCAFKNLEHVKITNFLGVLVVYSRTRRF